MLQAGFDVLASTNDILTVLQALSALQIRGSFYQSASSRLPCTARYLGTLSRVPGVLEERAELPAITGHATWLKRHISRCVLSACGVHGTHSRVRSRIEKALLVRLTSAHRPLTASAAAYAGSLPLRACEEAAGAAWLPTYRRQSGKRKTKSNADIARTLDRP